MLISQEDLAAWDSAAPLGFQEDQGWAGWLSSSKERAKVQQSVWTQGQGRQQKACTPAADGQGVFLWASESSPKQWMNSPLLQPGLTVSDEKAKEVYKRPWRKRRAFFCRGSIAQALGSTLGSPVPRP